MRTPFPFRWLACLLTHASHPCRAVSKLAFQPPAPGRGDAMNEALKRQPGQRRLGRGCGRRLMTAGWVCREKTRCGFVRGVPARFSI